MDNMYLAYKRLLKQRDIMQKTLEDIACLDLKFNRGYLQRTLAKSTLIFLENCSSEPIKIKEKMVYKSP